MTAATMGIYVTLQHGGCYEIHTTEDGVNHIPTKQKGATNLYHGSRLRETHQNQFWLDSLLIHLELSNLIGQFERTMVHIIYIYIYI